MKKNKQTNHRQGGQVVVEMVLLTVVMVSMTLILFKTLKEKEFLKKQISSPWVLLSGMIECGVWDPCGITSNQPGKHPSNRVMSFKPTNQ